MFKDLFIYTSVMVSQFVQFFINFLQETLTCSALFGLSCTRFAVTICHALLKSLSVGPLLAGMARYRRTYCDRRGKSFSWHFHHWSGSPSPSIGDSNHSIFMSHHTVIVFKRSTAAFAGWAVAHALASWIRNFRRSYTCFLNFTGQ